LGKRELIADGVNWIAGEPPREELRVTAKIRYRANEVPARVIPLAATRARVLFDEPLRDITPVKPLYSTPVKCVWAAG
jgi:tRNA-specific 2-thiouridylase